MVRYSFLTEWQVDAPIEQVWAVLRDVQAYPEWWKYVAAVEEVKPGDEAGLGAIYRYHWTTALPYGFVFEMEATQVEAPHVLEGTAVGELAGLGRWELEEADPGTTVRYRWEVATEKAWMNLVAPLARPAFVWNHGLLMREGGEALARKLGVPLLRNIPQVPDAEAENGAGRLPVGPAVAAGLAAVGGAVAYRRWRARTAADET